jgi:hypothetical protein
MLLSLRHGLVGALPGFVARFEISRRKDAGAGILVRSWRPGNRVRQSSHERHEPGPGPRILPQPLRAASPRAGSHGRFPGGPRRLRPPGALAGAGPFVPLLLPAKGAAALRRGGALPQGRGQAHPAVPRSGRTAPGGQALHHEHRRAGPGDDPGEPGGNPAPVLSHVEAAGEGGGGGDPSSGGDPEAGGGHPDGEGGATGRASDRVASGRNSADAGRAISSTSSRRPGGDRGTLSRVRRRSR